MAEHSAKAPLGAAGEILEWNRWCPRVVAELVSASANDQQQIALFQSDRVALAMKAQPAGAPFNDVEMREGSRRQTYRPRRRELTPTEDPPLQPQQVEDVGQDVSPASVRSNGTEASQSFREDQSHLKATWA